MVRALVAITMCLLLSGCLSSNDGGKAAVDQSNGPEGAGSESGATAGSAGASAAHGPGKNPGSGAATQPGAGAPANAERPWWALSVNAAPEGGLASFRWQAPANVLRLKQQNLDVSVQATGDVTSWMFAVAQDRGQGMEVGPIYSQVGKAFWSQSTLLGTTQGDTGNVPTAPYFGRHAGAIGNWSDGNTVWIIVGATGTGRIDLSFRVVLPEDKWPTTTSREDRDFALAGPRVALQPHKFGQGIAYDFFTQYGTLTHASSIAGGNSRTSYSPGIKLIGSTNLAAPIAQAGYVGLDWSAPWAKWSHVMWTAHDNLGARAVDYDVAAGSANLTGTMIVAGTTWANVGQRTALGQLTGDATGAGATFGWIAAATGDWMRMSVVAVALGASMADLTDVPAKTIRIQPPVVAV